MNQTPLNIETLAKSRAMIDELATYAATHFGAGSELCARAAGVIAMQQAEIHDMGEVAEMLGYIKKYVLKSVDGQRVAA